MKQDNKKALYESIMASVAREVKKVLNEDVYSDAMAEFEKIGKEMQAYKRKMYKEDFGITTDENIKKAEDAMRKCLHKEITEEQLDKYLETLKG